MVGLRAFASHEGLGLAGHSGNPWASQGPTFHVNEARRGGWLTNRILYTNIERVERQKVSQPTIFTDTVSNVFVRSFALGVLKLLNNPRSN